MATIKARRGWTNRHKVEPLPDDLVGRIEEKTGVLIPPALHDELVQAVRVYMATRDLVDGRPTIPEQRAGIEELHGKAKALVDCLKHLDDASKSVLIEHWDTLEKALVSATLVKGAAGRALKEDRFTKHQKGCSNHALYALVKALVAIYEESTNSRAGRGYYEQGGPFVRFAGVCFSLIDPQVKLEPTTLHNIIRAIQTS